MLEDKMRGGGAGGGGDVEGAGEVLWGIYRASTCVSRLMLINGSLIPSSSCHITISIGAVMKSWGVRLRCRVGVGGLEDHRDE